jgi:hypothetical protein
LVKGPVGSIWFAKSSYSHECDGLLTISFIIDGLLGRRRWPRNVAEYERFRWSFVKIFTGGISIAFVAVDDRSEECDDEHWEDLSRRLFDSFVNCSSPSSSFGFCSCPCWRCLSHVPILMKNQNELKE